MMKPAISLIFLFSVFAAESCKKPDNSIAGGGKGGNATIIARVDHHGDLLDTAIVYIKYGAWDAPSNGAYDDSVRVGANYQAVFTNLTAGSYYLLAIGIHDPYYPPTVEGGQTCTINGNNTNQTVTINTGLSYVTFPYAATHGNGGKTTIVARVQHNGGLLDTATIFVKYGALDAPANGLYDDSIKLGTGGLAVFTDLTAGDYYFFAKGADHSANPTTVAGGEPWTIKNEAIDTITLTTH